MDSHPVPQTAWALIVAVLLGGGFYVYGKHLDREPVPAATLPEYNNQFPSGRGTA